MSPGARLGRLGQRAGLALLAPLVAVVIAMAATSLLIIVSGSDSGVGDFWHVIASRPKDRILVDIVNQSAMLYLSAVAAAIGFRMGLFNIGVEGQYTLAAYAASVFAGAALLGGFLNIVASLVVAMVVGAAWAALAAVLKVYRGVSEVITTIMLNRIAPILISYFLNKYGLHGGNTVSTKEIPQGSQLSGWQPFKAPDGEVWSLVVIAVLVGIGFSVLIGRTRFGFELRATGISPTAAVASGIRVDRMVVIAMMLSGAVAGLVWMPALFGDAHQYGDSFQAGLGFTGIAVALLGRNRPVGMALGAVLFAFLQLQSNALTFATDISPNVIQITQGIAVLAVVVAYELVSRSRARLEQRQVADAISPTPVEATA